MDAATGGYQRADLIYWIERMGIGKTYYLLKQALHARSLGYNCLFITMEMPIVQIARRAVGVEVGLNPDYIRRGTISEYAMRRLRGYIDTMMHADNFMIYAGSFSKQASDVEALIHEIAPDIVYIDSAY